MPPKFLLPKTAMDKVAGQLQVDYQNLLKEYDIQDKTLLKSIYGTLKNIDLYNEQYQEALVKVKKVRKLQEKPSDQITKWTFQHGIFESVKGN